MRRAVKTSTLNLYCLTGTDSILYPCSPTLLKETWTSVSTSSITGSSPPLRSISFTSPPMPELGSDSMSFTCWDWLTASGPKRPGSWPWHYVLDKLGADIVSHARGIDANKLHLRKSRHLALVNSPRLHHMRQVNDFFCRLSQVGRQTDGFAVTGWLGEASSASLCQRVVRPDGTATLRTPSGKIAFFLELDRGTEESARLLHKMIDYDEASISRHLPKLVLFCFPSTRRERFARPALRASRLTVATSVFDWHLDRPLEPIWLALGGHKRLSLEDLSHE